MSAYLLPVVLSVWLLSPAHAQDWTDVDPRAGDVQDTLHELELADVERRALAVWRLWSWVVEHGDLARHALRAAEVDADARRLVLAVEAAPTSLPPLDGLQARLDVLVAALTVATPSDDPLSEAVAYLSFTDALARMDDVDGALAALEARAPAHPWLRATAATLGRRAAIEEIAATLERLGHPDVRGRARVEVTVHSEGGWDTTTRGWLLARDKRSIQLFYDAVLAGRTFPLDPSARVERLDEGVERQQWLTDPSAAWDDQAGDGERCLGYRQAQLVRAAWLLRLGEPLLACRLVRLAERDNGDGDPAVVVVQTLDELATMRTYEALEALANGAPREEVARALSGAVDVRARALASGHLVHPNYRDDLTRDHGRAVALRDGVEGQVEEDRLRAPPPSWETWQRWTPAERVACALTFLRDQAGQVWMDKAGCDPLFTDAVFPPDSPPLPPPEPGTFGWGSRRSVADRLIELGDAAVPALIELLDDARPTRSVEWLQVLPLSRVAERILESMWQAGLLRWPRAGEDRRQVARENQAKAREWLARWGTLGVWHAARSQEGEDHRRLRHAKALLRYDPVRARGVLPGLVATLGSRAQVDLLRALGDSADPAYAELHRGLLTSSDDDLAFEAALGLLRLGDRTVLARACDLSRRGGWSTERVFRLAEVGAPDEAGRILLEESDLAPGGDWELGVRMHDTSLPVADAHLALARVVARHQAPGWSEVSVEQLRALMGGATSEPRELALAALIDSIPAFVERPDRQRHAAVTALALGVDAVARFERAGGPAVRPLLHAALRSTDADPFVDALGNAGAAGADWAAQGATTEDQALLRAACVRASLRVRDLDSGDHGLWDWQFSPWRPELVAPLLAAWRASTTEQPGLELTIERAADLRGVTVRLAALTEVEAATSVHVRAPGLERDGPVADLDALLREVAYALERTPEAAATVRFRAFR
jgi:hypothetical protein